jgi:hypothetical protein
VAVAVRLAAHAEWLGCWVGIANVIGAAAGSVAPLGQVTGPGVLPLRALAQCTAAGA